jgi:cytochrome c553
MKKNLVSLAVLLVAASAISMACSGDDDDDSATTAGSGGSAGKGGSTTTAGSSGMSSAGKGGTMANGGKGGSSGSANLAGDAAGGLAGAGTDSGGQAGAGAENGGAGGDAGGAGGAAGASGAAGAAGAGAEYTPEMIARGTLIARSMALCGGCHTASGGTELAGNPAFKGGALPAPNLTPDATGLGDWSDQQIIDAFRTGIDNEGRHLDAAMPYWLFSNMSDDDALAVVAFLRSLPPASGAVGAANPDAAPVTPLSPSAFPNSTLQAGDADYAAAQQGKYLVSGVAQCVKCHSPSSAGLPTGSFFSGVAPTSGTQIFAPNITPDATGLSGWVPADIVTALKQGTNKAGATLCGSMPSAAKGYGGFTDADAHAIGVYLTTIPAVANAAADPSLEPACP